MRTTSVHKSVLAVALVGLLASTLRFAAACPPAEVTLAAQPAAAACPAGLTEVTFPLDGVQLVACVPFVPDYVASAAGDELLQTAVAVRWKPYADLSVYAVPYGARPASAGFEPAAPGAAAAYRTRLQAATPVAGGRSMGSRGIELFGEQVPGTMTAFDGGDRRPVMGATLGGEWLAEAGNRVWIVRSSLDDSAYPDARAHETALAALLRTSLRSPDLDRPSSSLAARARAAAAPPAVPAVPTAPGAIPRTEEADLPVPSWWNGDCDTNYYKAHAGTPAYGLGSSYRGVKACGPRPGYGATDVTVYFFAGAWGEYEWECVELSMRYLYLAYGQVPYRGNGRDVVWNYPGTRLTQITNGTANRAPQPGDVLSYQGATYGHTTIVSGSSVDSTGSGTATIVEQNASWKGTATLTVTNWYVQSSMVVTGWLHDSTTDACSAPATIAPADGSSLDASRLISRTVTFQWSEPAGCTHSGYTFRLCTTADISDTTKCLMNATDTATQRSVQVSGHDDQALWWGVRAANTADGAAWATARFAIRTDLTRHSFLPAQRR